MKLKFTLLMVCALAFLGSEVAAQRVAGPSTSRSFSGGGGARPSSGGHSASRPSAGRSYSAPKNHSQPSRPSGGKSYAPPSQMRGDLPVASKPPVSPSPGPGKPNYPTAARPKPDYPTSSRPYADPPRSSDAATPVGSRPNVLAPNPSGAQLNPSGSMNGTQTLNPAKQDNGSVSTGPNDGPAGQQMVMVCMFVAGSTWGNNSMVTQERADQLVAAGQAVYGSCSGDINGTNNFSMGGTGSLPPDPVGPGSLTPSGSLNGTPVDPTPGSNGGLHPSGSMNGTPITPPAGGNGGGHNGGGYNGGGGYYGGNGCGPTGGQYGGYGGGGYVGNYGCSTCPPPVLGFTWVGSYGGCQYNLCYQDLPQACTLYDVTYCGPDRRTIILTSPDGYYHIKVLERRYRAYQYGRNYGSGQCVDEWREVKRIQVECQPGCGICHRQ